MAVVKLLLCGEGQLSRTVLACNLLTLYDDVVRRVRATAVAAIIQLIEMIPDYQHLFPGRSLGEWRQLALEEEPDQVYHFEEELELLQSLEHAQTLDCPI